MWGVFDGPCPTPGIGPSLTLLSADAELNAAALAEGMTGFRHDPAAYLAQLEQQCLQLTLPS